MYIWEFLMLFFAVVCGSFAEYLLEHKIERDRERQFVYSLIEDLAVDTTQLNQTVHRFDTFQKSMDTVVANYGLLGKKYSHLLYSNIFKMSGYPTFYNCDRTMQQLKNSGAMRLISKPKCAKAIADYDNRVKDVINSSQSSVDDILKNYFFPKYLNMFDYQKILYDVKYKNREQLEKENRSYLLKTDKQSLAEFFNCIVVYQSVCFQVMEEEYKLKLEAAKLLKQLKKEYDIS